MTTKFYQPPSKSQLSDEQIDHFAKRTQVTQKWQSPVISSHKTFGTLCSNHQPKQDEGCFALEFQEMGKGTNLQVGGSNGVVESPTPGSNETKTKGSEIANAVGRIAKQANLPDAAIAPKTTQTLRLLIVEENA